MICEKNNIVNAHSIQVSLVLSRVLWGFFCLIDVFLITEKYLKKNITVAIKDVLNFNIYIK